MPKVDFNISQRINEIDAPGYKLAELGEKYPNIVVVNADLGITNRSKAFYLKFPERSFDVGIAEQNMVSFASGLAHEGFMPFVFTMSPFLTMRACEQVRTDICYGEYSVRLVGNAAGYASGVSGATHCGLEDVAIMGSMGGMTVVEAADQQQFCQILEASVAHKGPMYLRMGNEPVDAVYEHPTFEIGKAQVACEGDDGAFIVSGITVSFALVAARRIKEETGKSIRVVNFPTIKPLDKEAVAAAAKTGRVIVAHDHSVVGGLGYYVGAAIAEAGLACKFEILGAPDKYVPLATTPFLYRINEYDADGLVKHMKAML